MGGFFFLFLGLFYSNPLLFVLFAVCIATHVQYGFLLAQEERTSSVQEKLKPKKSGNICTIWLQVWIVCFFHFCSCVCSTTLYTWMPILCVETSRACFRMHDIIPVLVFFCEIKLLPMNFYVPNKLQMIVCFQFVVGQQEVSNDYLFLVCSLATTSNDSP